MRRDANGGRPRLLLRTHRLTPAPRAHLLRSMTVNFSPRNNHALRDYSRPLSNITNRKANSMPHPLRTPAPKPKPRSIEMKVLAPTTQDDVDTNPILRFKRWLVELVCGPQPYEYDDEDEDYTFDNTPATPQPDTGDPFTPPAYALRFRAYPA